MVYGVLRNRLLQCGRRLCEDSGRYANIKLLSETVVVRKRPLSSDIWFASRLLVAGVVGLGIANKKCELLAEEPGNGFTSEEEFRNVRAAIRDSNWSTVFAWVQQNGMNAVVAGSGQTGLAVAAEYGSVHIVQSLLANGASPYEGKDKNEFSVLMGAARNGHSRVVQILLENKVQPDSDMDIFGNAPIHMAVAFGHVGTTLVLLSGGSNPNLRQGDLRAPEEYMAETLHEAPMHLACRPKPPHVEVKRRALILALLKFGANPCIQDDQGDTPVHLLVRQGDIETLWSLLSYCSPDLGHAAVHLVTNSRGVTALEETTSFAPKLVLHLSPLVALLRQHLGWPLTDDAVNDHVDEKTEDAAWKIYRTRLDNKSV